MTVSHDVMRVADLEVVRLLTDPLKLKLLKLFAERPATARDAAEQLDENVTRLYRHIDALTEAGLLEVVAETPKRGTVERTFRAVARRFEVDHRLFGSDTGGTDEEPSPAVEFVRGTEDELLRAVASAGRSPAVPALLMRIRFRATEDRAAEVIESLNAWIETVASDDGPDEGLEYSGLLAVYPLEEE
jgi:DNA-binding transcriptional ArsR family regulator